MHSLHYTTICDLHGNTYNVRQPRHTTRSLNHSPQNNAQELCIGAGALQISIERHAQGYGHAKVNASSKPTAALWGLHWEPVQMARQLLLRQSSSGSFGNLIRCTPLFSHSQTRSWFITQTQFKRKKYLLPSTEGASEAAAVILIMPLKNLSQQNKL